MPSIPSFSRCMSAGGRGGEAGIQRRDRFLFMTPLQLPSYPGIHGVTWAPWSRVAMATPVCTPFGKQYSYIRSYTKMAPGISRGCSNQIAGSSEILTRGTNPTKASTRSVIMAQCHLQDGGKPASAYWVHKGTCAKTHICTDVNP